VEAVSVDHCNKILRNRNQNSYCKTKCAKCTKRCQCCHTAKLRITSLIALRLIMVALCNRADHIYFHAVVCSYFFFSSPNLSRRRLDVRHTSTQWCGLSANLRCRSETFCTSFTENTGRKKVAKNRHLGTIAQICRAISLQVRHVSTIGKKLIKQQYVFHMFSQYGELRPTSG